ncbi:MAG: secretin N-terminal domain-containing protein [Chlamydiales bacterium]
MRLKFTGTLTSLFLLLTFPLPAESTLSSLEYLFPDEHLSETDELADCAECDCRPKVRTRNSFYYEVPKDDVPAGTMIDITPSAALQGKVEQQTTQGSNTIPVQQRQHVFPTEDHFMNKSASRSRIYQLKSDEVGKYKSAECSPEQEGYTINFEDIGIIELLHFISKISGVNFIFEKEQLQFNVTMVSQEAMGSEDLTSALLQILKMHGLSVVEQGGTVLIYGNESLSKVSKVITDENVNEACDTAIITRVFRLYNVDPDKIGTIVKPLLSKDAVIEVSLQTRHLIVSDITSNVDKIADLLNALDTPNAAFEIAEYHVQSAYPAALVAYSREILAPLIQNNPMQMIAQPSAHKIFIVSTPYLINKALQILESLDAADVTDVADLPSSSMANNNIFMYKLRYHHGKEISQALQEVGTNLQFANVTNIELINSLYTVQWIEANNSIVVTGTQDAVEKIVMLLEDLDQPPKQVYLEVLIINTTLRNSFDFGVQWIALGDEQDKLAYASGLLSNSQTGTNIQGTSSTQPGARYISANPTNNPPAIPNPGRDVPLPTPSSLAGFSDISNSTSAFGLGIIGNIIKHNGVSFLTLGALVSALEEESDTTIVLNPRIMTEDTQTASFFVGSNIPYQTTSTVVGVTGATTQNIQYEDVGVQLKVTPTIAPNNIVSLQVDQTIAEVVSGQGTTLNPTTEKILASTKVHVPDGCFLVMSGHVRDVTTYTRSGIPCLGTLPLIGPTFSRNIEQREKSNLIMFIRPHVVTNIEESIRLTNEEGYRHNWDSNPASLVDEGPETAPECETYPPIECKRDWEE